MSLEAVSRPSRRTVLCVVALLLLSAGLSTWQAWVKSETCDEPMYIYCAYSYLRTGDLSLNREHPPLAKYLMALPLLALDLTLPPDYQQLPGNPLMFYARQPHAGVHEILFLARLPGVLLGIVLGLYVFRWGRLAFGDTAGLAALLLCELNPNLIAHSVIASNDFSVAVFSFATMYHVWRWLDTGSRASLLWGALMLGLAIGCKFTALMLLPVIGIIVLVVAIRRRRPALLGSAALALMAAAGVLWLLYGGEARSLADARQHARFARSGPDDSIFLSATLEHGLQKVFGDTTPIPLLTFLKGIDHQQYHAEHGHQNYFHLVPSEKGNPLFYVLSFLMKNPEAFSLLLLLGLVALPRARRSGVHEAALFGYPLLIMVVFSASDVQLGFKYVLAVVPFAAVAAARVLAPGPDGRPPRISRREALVGGGLMLALSLAMLIAIARADDLPRPYWVPMLLTAICAVRLMTERAGLSGRLSPGPAVALLLAWSAGSALAQQPDNLMYFNHWVGGPDQGWKWSVMGDDWGQDTVGLGDWMAANGLTHIHYDYYGRGDPELWGVHSTPSWGGASDFVPPDDFVAVHVSFLVRMPENYTWLKDKQPVAKIGHTIFIYDLRKPAS